MCTNHIIFRQFDQQCKKRLSAFLLWMETKPFNFRFLYFGGQKDTHLTVQMVTLFSCCRWPRECYLGDGVTRILRCGFDGQPVLLGWLQTRHLLLVLGRKPAVWHRTRTQTGGHPVESEWKLQLSGLQQPNAEKWNNSASSCPCTRWVWIRVIFYSFTYWSKREVWYINPT